MVKMQQGPAASGPSSSIGIVRFFDVETKGPKLTPEFVMGVTVGFILLVLLVRTFFIK
jgi:preprotein translocase subunit Sec61beta